MIEVYNDNEIILIPNDNIAGIYLDKNKNEKGEYSIIISYKYPVKLENDDDCDNMNPGTVMHFDDLEEAKTQLKEFKKIFKLSE